MTERKQFFHLITFISILLNIFWQKVIGTARVSQIAKRCLADKLNHGTKWLLQDQSVSEEKDDDDAASSPEVVSTTDFLILQNVIHCTSYQSERNLTDQMILLLLPLIYHRVLNVGGFAVRVTNNGEKVKMDSLLVNNASRC